MRKEIIWVAVIGIVFGLIIAFGAWRINSTISTNRTPGPSSSPSPSSPATGFKITLDKPQENDIVTKTPVTVTGITKPLAWVTVSGESGDYIIQSGDDGSFTQDVDLTPGVNQILVTAFGPQGEQSQARVDIVYSSSFQEKSALSPNTPSGNASGESQINQNIAQRLEQALNNPKAYIGSVTDITDSTLQIKDQNSQILQVSVGGTNITVVDTRGASPKTIKTTDIAIGDFIIAMGYVDNSQVLDAERIIVSDSVTETQIYGSLAKINSITRNSASVNLISDGSKMTLQPDKNTDIEIVTNGKSKSTKFSSLNTGDEIIYLTESNTGTTTPRSIFDISQATPSATP